MAATSAPLPTTVAGRKKVVVVEDDPDTRELELFLLAAEGYEVVGVADGTTAFKTIKDEAADLVLLDMMLPGKDGLEILGELAREPATAKTPVVVVSAYVNRLLGQQALRRRPQVKEIVRKPFDITELLGAISQALAPE